MIVAADSLPYAFKTIVDQDNDTLLGAHLVGFQVEEVINLFAMAVKAKMTTKNLKNWSMPNPGCHGLDGSTKKNKACYRKT
nr:hypothetical protein [Tunicatimonas sp. TK19036]